MDKEKYIDIMDGDESENTEESVDGIIVKLEYLIRPVSYTVEELNKLGQEGWEMCGFDYDEKNDSEIFSFKLMIE